MWHTANWPHEPVEMAGKKVAIIGSGPAGLTAAFGKAESASSKFRESVETAFKKSEEHAHHAEGVFSKVFAAISAEKNRKYTGPTSV